MILNQVSIDMKREKEITTSWKRQFVKVEESVGDESSSPGVGRLFLIFIRQSIFFQTKNEGQWGLLRGRKRKKQRKKQVMVLTSDHLLQTTGCLSATARAGCPLVLARAG